MPYALLLPPFRGTGGPLSCPVEAVLRDIKDLQRCSGRQRRAESFEKARCTAARDRAAQQQAAEDWRDSDERSDGVQATAGDLVVVGHVEPRGDCVHGHQCRNHATVCVTQMAAAQRERCNETLALALELVHRKPRL